MGARGWIEDSLQGLTVLEGQVVSLPHPWTGRQGLRGPRQPPPSHPGAPWLARCPLTVFAVQLDHQAAAPLIHGDAAFLHGLLQHHQRAEDGQERLSRGNTSGLHCPSTDSSHVPCRPSPTRGSALSYQEEFPQHVGHLHTPRSLFWLLPVWNALKHLFECHHSLQVPGRIHQPLHTCHSLLGMPSLRPLPQGVPDCPAHTPLLS